MIYKANGEKYKSNSLISDKLFINQLSDYAKPNIFNTISKISDLRKSCGAESQGKRIPFKKF